MTIGRKMAKGAVWMVGARVCDRVIGLVSTIILARLLLPGDFGLVSMAMTVIAMLELLADFKFDVVLIQNQGAERKHYDTAWTFNILVGVASAIPLLLLAAPAAQFFREPRLEAVVSALAIVPFVTGFENIGTVEFRKQLAFGKEFGFAFARRLASFVVVVPLAFALRNYWALVLGVIAGRFVRVALSYALHPYRPRLSLKARGELFGFSKWLMIGGVFSMLVQRAPDLVVGRIAGTGALGLFNVSHELAFLPTTQIVAPVNRAAYPGYAKKASQPAVLRESFLDVMSVLLLLMIPAAIGVILTADLIVPVLLGDKWLAARSLIKPLAFAGLLVATQTNLTYVFLALGKPKISTVTTIMYVAMLLPLMALFTQRAGVHGAAWTYVLTAAVAVPVRFVLMKRILDLAFGAFLARMWRPVAATALMAGALSLLTRLLPDPMAAPQQAWQLLLMVSTGVVVYVAGIIGSWRMAGSPAGAESFLWQVIREKLVLIRRKDSPPVADDELTPPRT